MIKPKGNSRRIQGAEAQHGEGTNPNWVLVAGGAVLSTLAVRFGCHRFHSNKDPGNATATNARQERVKSEGSRRPGACRLHSSLYNYPPQPQEDGAPSDTKLVVCTDEAADTSLPLAKVPTQELRHDGGVLWSSAPELLGLPQKPFNQSNCSESPCPSESGSDIYVKREVIQKLRQQLQRRDEMIMEMQSQIMDLRNSLRIQTTHTANLQSQIESANRELFDSDREIQQLRKAIADHCSAELGSLDKSGSGKNWPPDSANGHINGYMESARDLELQYNGGELNGDETKVPMLKIEVGELKEVIQGKDYLLESYKEQKVELSSKLKELQLKLTSQVPHIL